jgi:hypothetical protein
MIHGLRILTLSGNNVEGFYDQAKIKPAQSYGNVNATAKEENMQLCTPNLSLVMAEKIAFLLIVTYAIM